MPQAHDPKTGRFIPYIDPRPTIDKFMENVVKHEDECWYWKGWHDYKNYGKFSPEPRRSIMAHRWIFEYTYGKIPEGAQLDHLCSNKSCVNPDHLEPVSGKENVQRYWRRRKMFTALVLCKKALDRVPFDELQKGQIWIPSNDTLKILQDAEELVNKSISGQQRLF